MLKAVGYIHLHCLVNGNGVDSDFIFLANFSLLLGEVQKKKRVWENVFSDQLLLKILNQSSQKGKRFSRIATWLWNKKIMSVDLSQVWFSLGESLPSY